MRLPLFAALFWANVSAFTVLTQPTTSFRYSRLYASVEQALKKPGTAEMPVPWEDLGFEFRPTNSNVRMTFKDGEWGEMELVKVRIRRQSGSIANLYFETCMLESD